MPTNKQDLHNKIIDQLPYGYAYHKIIYDEKGKPNDYVFLEVNAAFELFTGIEAAQLVHKTATQVFPDIKKSGFDWIAAYSEVATTSKPKQFEQFFPPLNRWYRIFASSLEAGHFFTVFTDITTEKVSESKLQESEEKFTVAFHKAPFTMALTDVNTGRIEEVNDAFAKILGYTRKELIGKQTVDLGLWANPNDRDAVLKELMEGRSVFEKEIPIRKKTGEIINGLFSASIIQINNKPYILSTNEDITARKKTEQALRESEEKFARAFQLAPFSITLTDGQTEHIVEVNEAFTKSTGYSREEVLNKSSASLHLWAREEDRKLVIKDLMQGIPVLGREYEFVNKDGSRVFGSFSATVISINNRPYVLGSIEDITEKTLLRQKLDKELAFRQYLFDNAKDGHVLIDNDFKVVDTNTKFCQMTGYESDQLNQTYFWEIDAMLTKQDMHNMFDPEEGFVSAYETKLRNSEGVLNDVEVSAWGFMWKGEKIIFCTCRDISAQKFKTNKLLGIERRYENLLENLNGVLFELASDGTILYISSLIKEMAGYETEDCLNRHFNELFHPEDLPQLMHDFEQLQQGIEYPFDYRAMTKNGEVIWVRCMAKRAEETASQVRYRGVVQNITQLKETEAKLREAEQKLSALLDG